MSEQPGGWAVPGGDPDRRPGPPPEGSPAEPQQGTTNSPGSPSGQQPPAGWGQQPGWNGQGQGQPGYAPPPGAPDWSGGGPGGNTQQPWAWGSPQQPPAPGGQQQPGGWNAPQQNGWGGGWGQAPHQGGWGAPPPSGGWGSPTPGQPGWQRGMGRGAGIIPLRPLSIGEIFDGSIRAIRSNPRTMVGFSALVGAVITLLGTVPQAIALNTFANSPLGTGETVETFDTADLAELISAGGLSVLVGLVQSLLSTTIITGLLIVAVGAAVRGEALAPGELWRRARGRMWAVLGLALLLLVLAPLIVLLGMVPGGLMLWLLPDNPVAGVIVLIVGTLLGTLVYMALYLGFWTLGAPALLLENLGVLGALRRSAQLVRGSFWRVLGISVLTAVIAYVVRQIFSVPFSLIGTLLAEVADFTGLSGAVVQLLISDIGTILAGAVVYPFSAGAVALLYLDLRMRREGLDVDVLRSEQPR
ncbi:hypothetical protein KIH74_15355 [Kineosporia sp. J2-2]|uniref:DUF7847 domain-containing protein n=1 Tax=Kineosporia corallincola TaxID=2835133 RepID=A0ABS5THH8_9ACTN|nr:hypothetical protein [Kineosporia corallincola]MBT0770318.1 hypothetical protein [Kineosporia corallincola]